MEGAKELAYARHLLEIHELFIAPMYTQNADTMRALPEPFNRLFMLMGASTSWFCGKTIHNTLLSNTVGNHYADAGEVPTVPMELGHNSHFRKLYNIDNKPKSISEFYFDLNYFLCYYKPIVKRLNLTLVY